MNDATTTPQKPPPSVLGVLFLFLKVGVTAFGGGTTAFAHRELVERTGWLTEQAFLTGLTIAQVLPGANPVNLALYFGTQLRGKMGGAAAVFGMVMPGFCLILCFGILYSTYSDYPVTHVALMGLAAAGVGATCALGVKVATKLDRSVMPILIAAGTFASVGIMHWPMVNVIVVVVPLSLWLSFRKEKERNKSHV